MDLILEEVRRFVSEPVTAEELADCQDNFVGRLPLSMESNSGVAAAMINLVRYGLDMDYYLGYPAMIRSVTPEAVLEAARRYLDPERLAIASAGPAQMGRRHEAEHRRRPDRNPAGRGSDRAPRTPLPGPGIHGGRAGRSGQQHGLAGGAFCSQRSSRQGAVHRDRPHRMERDRDPPRPEREPILLLHGEARRLAQAQGLEHWSISLSHSASHAIAVVVAAGDGRSNSGSD